MEEIWKATEYPNYEVSNLGNIRYNNGVLVRNKKTRLDRYGYLVSDFYFQNKNTGVKIHRLIAHSFIPNKNNYKTVNHINGIKTDNRIENLEWCTQEYNASHSWKIGLITKEKIPHASGVKNNRSYIIHQLSLDDKLIKIHHGTREASRNTGVSQAAISSCVTGKYKQSNGFKWIRVHA